MGGGKRALVGPTVLPLLQLQHDHGHAEDEAEVEADVVAGEEAGEVGSEVEEVGGEVEEKYPDYSEYDTSSGGWMAARKELGKNKQFN